MKKGLIVKSISGEYTIECSGELFVCKPRGVFRFQGKTPKVGDIVEISDDNMITKIFPRKNDLVRPFVSNVDKAFLVFSVKEPDLNLNLLDRLLSVMEYNDIQSIILFTKLDLLNEKEKEDYNVIKEYYKKIGYKIYETDKQSYDNEILNEFDDCVCFLSGQSGVGKSSLLNKIDYSLLLKTNEISQALGRGKHTTRHVELFKIGNGYLADSPGFGIVEFSDIDLLTLSQTFVEFFEASTECKFAKCTHYNEPKCAVKAKVESKEILKSRYDNYLLFVKEIEKNIKNKY